MSPIHHVAGRDLDTARELVILIVYRRVSYVDDMNTTRECQVRDREYNAIYKDETGRPLRCSWTRVC